MRGETIVVTRKGAQTGEDSQGNPIYATTTVYVDGCAFAPRSSEESRDTFGGRVLTGGTVYAPKGTRFYPSDVLTIRGDTYHIEGEAGVWVSPYTRREMGVEVAVKRGS